MRHSYIRAMQLSLIPCFFLTGSGGGKNDRNAGATPPLRVERAENPNIFQVEHPEQFALATAVEYMTTSELKVTGSVTPDISRTVPGISLATGRGGELKAGVGDFVPK